LAKDPVTAIPPALEELIAEAIQREMKKRQADRTILEFLVSNEGISLPDGVDLLLEELRHSPSAIKGPRCSICGLNTSDDMSTCKTCGKKLCESCLSSSCECKAASVISKYRHLYEALWIATGLIGTWAPWFGFLFLLTQDSLAGFYFVGSMISMIASTVYCKRLPWIGILEVVTGHGS
jgi:hypothetical protein